MVNALTYYKRKLVEQNIEPPLQSGNGDSIYNDLQLSTDEQSLVLKVTRQEYYDLLSSALNGAYTTFPENFNNVIYPLIKAGKLSFCDEVLNCVQTNQDVSEAIRQASSGQYYDVNQAENITILDTDLLEGQGQTDCDNDNLFGATTQLTDLLNTISSDVLELFETAFATPSRLGDVIEAIPGVGELPVDDALQALEKFSQQVKSAYDASYDSQLRDDFRCELFCIAQNNCALTMEDVRDYFKDKITVDVSTADSFLNLMHDILINNWLGLQSVYMMHWFILDAIIFGTEILGIDVNRLSNQIAIFFNDPDSDWNILCDPCISTWESTLDFTVNQYGALVAVDSQGDPIGVYTPNIGFEAINFFDGRAYRAILIQIPFDARIITSWEVDQTVTKGNYISWAQGFDMMYQSLWLNGTQDMGSRLDRTWNAVPSGQQIYNDVVSGISVNADEMQVYIRTSYDSYSGDGLITRVKLYGEGTKPPQLP